MAKARYDEIADWYPTWVGGGDGLIAEGVGDLLPLTVRGARVLDVACGHGRASRGLARLGADVVGVDLSTELVASARAREVANPLGIDYYAADVADPGGWWDGAFFDGAVCEMALMDIEDLRRCCRRDGSTGWLVRDLDGSPLLPRERGRALQLAA